MLQSSGARGGGWLRAPFPCRLPPGSSRLRLHATPATPRVRCAAQGFGSWNLRDVKFLTGSQLGSWGIACFANPRFAEADLTRTQAERGGPSFIKARLPGPRSAVGRAAPLVAAWLAGADGSRAGQVPPSAACLPGLAWRRACSVLVATHPAPYPPPQEFIDMLNACGVLTPTNPLPPCIMAPRNASPAETMRRTAEAARQTFNRPCQLVLVVLPDTGGRVGGWLSWLGRMSAHPGACLAGPGAASPVSGLPTDLHPPAGPYSPAAAAPSPPSAAGQQLYKEVKQAGDSMLGIPSQCVVSKKAGIGFPARGRPQCEPTPPAAGGREAVAAPPAAVHLAAASAHGWRSRDAAAAAAAACGACPPCADCANVAMKMNAKLDGCNVKLAEPMATLAPPFGPRPFMVLGVGPPAGHAEPAGACWCKHEADRLALPGRCLLCFREASVGDQPAPSCTVASLVGAWGSRTSCSRQGCMVQFHGGSRACLPLELWPAVPHGAARPLECRRRGGGQPLPAGRGAIEAMADPLTAASCRHQ